MLVFIVDFNSTPQWPICPNPAHGGTSITSDFILMQLQISVGNLWSCQVCLWICFYSYNKMWKATNESGEEFWVAHNVNTQCSNVMKYELWITPHKSGLVVGLEATLARFMNTSNFKCSSLFLDLWPLAPILQYNTHFVDISFLICRSKHGVFFPKRFNMPSSKMPKMHYYHAHIDNKNISHH